jgi:hypothetical protein
MRHKPIERLIQSQDKTHQTSLHKSNVFDYKIPQSKVGLLDYYEETKMYKLTQAGLRLLMTEDIIK